MGEREGGEGRENNKSGEGDGERMGVSERERNKEGNKGLDRQWKRGGSKGVYREQG